MKRLIGALALMAAAASPAAAGGRWVDVSDDYYVVRHYRHEDRRVYAVPEAPHVYVPYGAYYADYDPPADPYVEVAPVDVAPAYQGDRECIIKRKWRNGRMTEKVRCSDD